VVGPGRAADPMRRRHTAAVAETGRARAVPDGAFADPPLFVVYRVRRIARTAGPQHFRLRLYPGIGRDALGSSSDSLRKLRGKHPCGYAGASCAPEAEGSGCEQANRGPNPGRSNGRSR
jgi:hypothetical protein